MSIRPRKLIGLTLSDFNELVRTGENTFNDKFL